MGDATIVLPGWVVVFLVFAVGALTATVFGLVVRQIERQSIEASIAAQLVAHESKMAGKMQPLATEIDAIQMGLTKLVMLIDPNLMDKVSFTDGSL